ncbi:crotonase/enoyl-CoA hydratase family protein [Streptomyces adelaidensis]|uniref:crotonase/enoyl-CoA hydratase family protein n=1 Tax=Streptomyces adelaidensis TaxID=2796465 RepID=UPI0019054F41|nr:crotonase/enoyl-CoA hydratase family protein [Streptomyces adelaidensis]
MFELIRLDVADRVATITLNRPDTLNGYSVAMKDELIAAFDAVDADREVGAVIVTGAGRAFCAGMDLSDGYTFARLDEPEHDRVRDSGGELALRIYACTKPVIAAINGAAVGVGITMTLPMDIRLATENSKFGFVFARRGIVLESCSSWFLPRIVGVSRAAEWAYTGRVFSAGEALAAGLVRSVHPADELMPAARELALEIVRNTSPVSVALNRQLLWRMLGAGHPMTANVAESRAMYSRGLSADSAEGVASFLERRPAVFPESVPADLPNVFGDRPDPEFHT